MVFGSPSPQTHLHSSLLGKREQTSLSLRQSSVCCVQRLQQDRVKHKAQVLAGLSVNTSQENNTNHAESLKNSSSQMVSSHHSLQSSKSLINVHGHPFSLTSTSIPTFQISDTIGQCSHRPDHILQPATTTVLHCSLSVSINKATPETNELPAPRGRSVLEGTQYLITSCIGGRQGKKIIPLSVQVPND